MKVNVRIDRLVVEGTELTPAERAALAATVRSELARLLNAPVPRAAAPAAGARRTAAGPGARDIARAVAAAIHHALPAGQGGAGDLPVQARSAGARR